MGQAPFEVPSVKGWPVNEQWLTLRWLQARRRGLQQLLTDEEVWASAALPAELSPRLTPIPPFGLRQLLKLELEQAGQREIERLRRELAPLLAGLEIPRGGVEAQVALAVAADRQRPLPAGAAAGAGRLRHPCPAGGTPWAGAGGAGCGAVGVCGGAGAAAAAAGGAAAGGE
jgi:hypothetical protein